MRTWDLRDGQELWDAIVGHQKALEQMGVVLGRQEAAIKRLTKIVANLDEARRGQVKP